MQRHLQQQRVTEDQDQRGEFIDESTPKDRALEMLPSPLEIGPPVFVLCLRKRLGESDEKARLQIEVRVPSEFRNRRNGDMIEEEQNDGETEGNKN
ncbi:uncharacterized protein LOC111027196 [Myzus persicae]|uniref:uncharacterized protein LOC111027196 n=1 Tax=Myzus persicae TaxID=13164 RepID=UPI000B939B30|nr:uncharacterized protein LOC111027196 [Myzus persicae]